MGANDLIGQGAMLAGLEERRVLGRGGEGEIMLRVCGFEGRDGVHAAMQGGAGGSTGRWVVRGNIKGMAMW